MDIKTLTKTTHLKVYNLEIDKSNICPICLANINSNEIVRVLSCKHTFHQECIDNWFFNNKSCPCCRLKHKNVQETQDLSTSHINYTEIFYIGGSIMCFYYVRKNNLFYNGIGLVSGLFLGFPVGIILGINSFYLAMINFYN